MTSLEELLLLINEGEHTKLEFKESRILNDNYKLAKTITSIANAGGGILLIGVKNDKSIDGIEYKQGHEEHLMNVTYELCEPIVKIKFEKVEIPEKGYVYVIRVPSKSSFYHAVKGSKGYSFYMRHGSTTRELGITEVINPDDLVEENIRSSDFCKYFGKFIIQRIYGNLNANLTNFIRYCFIASIVLIFVPLLLMFGYNERIVIKLIDYPYYIQLILFFSLVIGLYMFSCIESIPNTRCPECMSYFSFYPAKKIIYEKEIITEYLEHEKSRIIKLCDNCGYEEIGKMMYRKIELKENN